jgi:hypothetical protein
MNCGIYKGHLQYESRIAACAIGRHKFPLFVHRVNLSALCVICSENTGRLILIHEYMHLIRFIEPELIKLCPFVSDV